MKLLLNGILIPSEEYTGAKDIIVDVKRSDDDGEREVSVSSEFTFTGSAYDMIEAEMIEPADGRLRFLSVKIYDNNCCSPTDTLVFEGIIRGDMINWCHEQCSVKCQVIEHTAETKKLDCIRSTVIFDNWNGFQSQIHPRIVYCNEMRPDLLQQVVLIFGVIMNIALAILTPVVAIISVIVDVINAIINAINTLGFNIGTINGFDGDGNTNLLQEWQNMRDRLNEVLIGCGRKHPSPFTRSYIQNVCDKCGVTFVSSIYNNPLSEYYNSMYLSAPIEKGTRDESILWIDANHPIKTLDGFLDELKLVHNAKWELIDDTLYFERKDFFYSGDIWVNFETEDSAGTIVEDSEGSKLCLEWRDEKSAAYGNFQYSQDPVDPVGNEALPRYNDIVEWNLPFNEMQAGHQDVILPFGVPRFRDDNIDEDILGQFATAPFGLGDQIQSFQSVLILQKGIAFQPKLLIWDPATDITEARIKRYTILNTLVDPPQLVTVVSHNYNFPYMFNEINAETNTAYPTDHPQSGLYPRFYSINNPKTILATDKGKSFTFRIRYNCSTLSTALDAQFVQLPYGIGRIKSMQINLNAKEILVQGDV